MTHNIIRLSANSISLAFEISNEPPSVKPRINKVPPLCSHLIAHVILKITLSLPSRSFTTLHGIPVVLGSWQEGGGVSKQNIGDCQCDIKQ